MSTSPYWLTGSPIQRRTLEAGDALAHERPDHDEPPLAAHGDDGERQARRCARVGR